MTPEQKQEIMDQIALLDQAIEQEKDENTKGQYIQKKLALEKQISDMDSFAIQQWARQGALPYAVSSGIGYGVYRITKNPLIAILTVIPSYTFAMKFFKGK